MTSPIIKWVGGKTRLLPELVKRMPRSYNRYFEPFAGGAALFFHLEPQCPVFLSDVNADLIAMYRAVRDDPDGVILYLRKHERRHDEANYYKTRDEWNARHDGGLVPAEHAAMFIYLNKTCFNGLWRVNKAGEFNVPMGDIKNPKICDESAIRAASAKLRGVVGPGCGLAAGGFEVVVSACGASDFVYFDPPYDPVSPTSSFTSYAGAFGQDEQRRLARVAQSLVSRGVQVMLSNSDTPFIRDLYAWARVDTVQCPRAINSKGDKRGAVNELIITGGYDPWRVTATSTRSN